MKISIKPSHIRIKLGKKEIKDLIHHQMVTQSIQFGLSDEETMYYTLQTDDNESELSVLYAGNQLRLIIPTDMAIQWGAKETYIIDEYVEFGDDRYLRVSVIKKKCFAKGDNRADEAVILPHPSLGNRLSE